MRRRKGIEIQEEEKSKIEGVLDRKIKIGKDK